MARHRIKWKDSGLAPKEEPDPAYPEGVDLDISEGKIPACTVSLPYPARRIGLYLVECELCRIRIACTTAGRPDDPRSIKIACKLPSKESLN
jgi:hypothetical protein